MKHRDPPLAWHKTCQARNCNKPTKNGKYCSPEHAPLSALGVTPGMLRARELAKKRSIYYQEEK